MALIPYTFEAGTIAASAEVNANFAAVAAVVGDTSTASGFRPPGRQILGPRRNYEISAQPDTAYGDNSYLQIAYNANNQNQGSGVWQVERFVSSEPATGLRLGKDGFSVWTTSRTTGNLHSQYTKVFGLTATSTEDRCFIKSHITRSDAIPNEIDDYRLTYVPFATPYAIYNGTVLSSGTQTYTASSLTGVPSNAIAVQLVCEMAAGGSDVNIKFMKAKSSPTIADGFGVYVAANKTNGGEGIVHLGDSGTYLGKFTITASGSFTQARIWVKGAWI